MELKTLPFSLRFGFRFGLPVGLAWLGQVVTLNKEKSELEAELLPIQSEKNSLKFRVIEAEKVGRAYGTLCSGRGGGRCFCPVLNNTVGAAVVVDVVDSPVDSPVVVVVVVPSHVLREGTRPCGVVVNHDGKNNIRKSPNKPCALVAAATKCEIVSGGTSVLGVLFCVR